MQYSIQKFRKNCIVLERLGILPEKLRSLNYRRVKYFLLNLCTRFPLTNVCRRVFGVFLFCLHLKLFAKNKKKRIGFYKLPESRFFTSLFITHDVNEIKKKIKNNLTFLSRKRL